MLLSGGKADGVETHLAPALLYDLEGIPVHVLDIPALYGLSSHTPEEACAQVQQRVHTHSFIHTMIRFASVLPMSISTQLRFVTTECKTEVVSSYYLVMPVVQSQIFN